MIGLSESLYLFTNDNESASRFVKQIAIVSYDFCSSIVDYSDVKRCAVLSLKWLKMVTSPFLLI